MTLERLINDLKLYAVICGFIGLVFCLFGAITWNMEHVVYGGGGLILACCGYGLLTRWEEKGVLRADRSGR